MLPSIQNEVSSMKKELRKFKRRRLRADIKLRLMIQFKKIKGINHQFLRKTPLNEDELYKIMHIMAVSYDDLKISLECLESPKELNDDVINTYLGLYDMTFVFVHSSHFYNKLTQGGYKFSNASFWKHQLKDFRAILFPLHVNGNHWIIAAADVRVRRLLVYDSMSTPNETPKYLETIENLILYLNELSAQKWKWVMMDCAQQTNTYDCGVYCCTFGLALIVWYNNNALSLPPYFDIKPDDIFNQRHHIKLNLIG